MSASDRPAVNVWLARDGWRWRYRSENGHIQAESGEAYTRRGDCLKALRQVTIGLPRAKTVVAPGPAKAPRLPPAVSAVRPG